MGTVCNRCSSNLYPPQPGIKIAARDESSAGTHQALRRTPSVLGSFTSLYPSPTDTGVASGRLRRGAVIHSTTSNPAPKYPRARVARRTSAWRNVILILALRDTLLEEGST